MSRAVVDAKEFSHAMSKISKILKKCAIPSGGGLSPDSEWALHIDGNRSRNMAYSRAPGFGR